MTNVVDEAPTDEYPGLLRVFDAVLQTPPRVDPHVAPKNKRYVGRHRSVQR